MEKILENFGKNFRNIFRLSMSQKSAAKQKYIFTTHS